MPGYRQIHSRMWSSDQWFAELPKDQKLLFIYLFSNERASISGLYELPLRVIAFETGMETAEIKAGLEAFARADKVLYDFEKQVVWVRKMLKYQGSASPKVKNRIKADVASVPDCSLKTRWLSEYTLPIGYGYGIAEDGDGIDTSSSISIYSSSYSSSSLEGGGTGGETKPAMPKTPRQAVEHPDMQLFQQVCNRIPGERDYVPVIETVQFLKEKHPDVVAYLKRFWTAWSTRKTRDGKPYSEKSLVWLYEWAMNDDIPKANGHEPQLGEDMKAIIRKAAGNVVKR